MNLNHVFLGMQRINLTSFRFPLLLSLVALLVFLASPGKTQSFEEGKELVVIRKIGHEILLHLGNEYSRVLPVKQIQKREYQIEFEHPFSFHPDSLITVIDQVISTHKLPDDYLVNVLDCQDLSIVYAYTVLPSMNNSILPCKERMYPKNCYQIHLKFAGPDLSDQLLAHVPGSLALFAGCIFLFIGIRNYSNTKSDSLNSPESETPELFDLIKIGRYHFSFEEQFLSIEGEKISLTGKETKLLRVFADAINRTLDRELIQQEVWGSEGVIVGRSLDMFISKLRKKLKGDPDIKLVNIHGKGYKLEVK